MRIWLFRLLLVMAILVNVVMLAMWAFAIYLFASVTSAPADPESERWAASTAIFLIIATGLIGLGIYGLVKGWKLSNSGQFGSAARWIGLPMLLQVVVMGVL